MTDKPDEPVTEENIYDNNEMENQNNEISDNQHIVKFENNENSQIRKDDNKEQIKKTDEKNEAMNNMIAIVDLTKLKKGKQISFTSNNIFYKAEIINHAGKSTGNYSDWFNISYYLQNKKGDVESIELKTVENLKLYSNE